MQEIITLILSLILDASYSWVRMLIALFVSVILAFFIGIYMALSKRAETLLMPIIDILQTIPILAFFPFAIYVIVGILPGYIGINAAVIFLIITSMLWNIIFGVYEAIKTLPNEFYEISKLYKMSTLQKVKNIFIPASLPRVVEQSMLSWSIGLFYLVSSEIFSTGSATYQVKYSIGVAITQLATSGNTFGYVLALLIFLIFVIITRFALFGTLERYVNKTSKKHIHKQEIQMGLKLRKFVTYTKNEEKEIVSRFKVNFFNKKTSVKQDLKIKKNSPLYEYYILVFILIFSVLVLILTNTLNYEIVVLESLFASILRIWFAFLVLAIVAIVISVYIIFISGKQGKYTTLFQILASIPATILLPELVIIFRSGSYGPEVVAFIIFFLSGVWYMIFSILGTAKTINTEMLEVKEVFGIRKLEAWKKIYIPAIIPGMITGAITAIAAEWNASILAESFEATHVSMGLGYLLDLSLSSNNLILMSIALINMTAMIIIINKLVWRRFYDKVSVIYR
ncbi:MAG: ABC transporter permease subunit [Candidatus Micrarchaeia archaeon]